MGSLRSENVIPINWNITEKYFIMQVWTEKQNAVLIGGLLGDLHIQKGKTQVGTCRLRFCHSTKQKEFVDWKYEVFKKDFCQTTKPLFIESKTRHDYLFYTSYKKEFIAPHSSWYSIIENPDPDIGQQFVKKIPLNIADILTDPLALAVWYLDDGTKRSDTNSCRIATQFFLKEEHKLLQNCLYQNFHVDVKIEDWGRSKSGEVLYSLAILSRTGQYQKFRDITYHVVKAEIPSMLYKL